MPDIHSEKFDDATQIKLLILQEYLKEWLPVFLKARKKWWKDIFIYDFFAGEGYDIDGNEGSPLIILKELKVYQEDIIKEGLNLKLLFNDINPNKIEKLKTHIKTEDYNFDISFEQKDFTQLFNELYPNMIAKKSDRLPRFMFIDQYGVKYVTKKIFSNLADLTRTDFLFFISSHFVKRFSELDEFKKYISITKQEFDENKPYQCHRVVFEYFRNMIPKSKEVYLAPFSLRKEESNNVYGLIFGSHNILGIEKFLKLAWRLDGEAGEANFNIDGAILEGHTYDMFNPDTRANKLQLFEKDLISEIKNNKIKDLKSVYIYTFNYGCLPKHANEILKALMKNNAIKKDLSFKSSNIHKLEGNIFLK